MPGTVLRGVCVCVSIVLLHPHRGNWLGGPAVGPEISRCSQAPLLLALHDGTFDFPEAPVRGLNSMDVTNLI